MTTLHQFVTDRIYKNRLSPKFWDENLHFDGDTRIKLLEIAKDFTDSLGITRYIKDIILTGSLANYNYTRHSDLDVHILLDFTDIDQNKVLVKTALDGKRFMWNIKHNIIMKKHEVELYFQDINEPHIASGVFSIQDNKWIKRPKYDPPEVDEKYVEMKANQIKLDIVLLKNKLNSANDEADFKELHDKSVKYREKILKMRRDSLRLKGEYGIGNLVFKQLRNGGYIKEIIDISNIAYDKIFSIW